MLRIHVRLDLEDEAGEDRVRGIHRNGIGGGRTGGQTAAGGRTPFQKAVEQQLNTEIVHADAAGFMAAMLTPGMRAVSITISADSGAGGFILPNDRVDLIMIQKSSDGKNSTRARTIMTNVRVLAVDQTFKQEKDANTVIGKTATLELMPGDAELVARAQSQGQISLALRPLTDAQPAAVASAAPVSQATGAPLDNGKDEGRDDENSPDHVAVIRYGVSRGDAPGGGGAEKPRPQ